VARMTYPTSRETWVMMIGVRFGPKVVDMAEEILRRDGHLYCLGEIVHNVMEIERLKKLGLEIIDHEAFSRLSNCKVLVRAHGEPPETYAHAERNNIEIIDGTCPIVLKLQDRIEKDFRENELQGSQIVIYGKKDHAEVRGLAGQTGYRSVIVESEQDLDRIDFSKPVIVYAQTTMNRSSYNSIVKEIQERIRVADPEHEPAVCNNTICGQVSGRLTRLKKFCREHDAVVFASSLQSSNGKLLYQECRKENERAHFVSTIGELKPSWFNDCLTVGVTGATSTPRWFLEEISAHLNRQLND